MKNKTLESKTNTQPSLSPYQAERAEAQQTPVLRLGPPGGARVPPGSEATVRAHAASLNRTTAGRTLRQLQRQYGNRYVQRLVELVQRRGSGEGFRLDHETAGRINRARAGGQPLDGTVQAQMSEALGHDFSRVRVHTDTEAHRLNRLLSARAFTTGHDIFFRRGEYNPGSGTSRELIAHELTHVVQQSSGRVRGGANGITVRPAGDAFEEEAEAASNAAHLEDLQGPKQDAAGEEVRPDLAHPADILDSQRTVGKLAVQRYIQQNAIQRDGDDDIPAIFNATNLRFMTEGSLYFKSNGGAGRYRHKHTKGGPQASVYDSVRQGSINDATFKDYKNEKWWVSDEEWAKLKAADKIKEYDIQHQAGKIRQPPKSGDYVFEIQDAGWQKRRPDKHVSESKISDVKVSTGAWGRIEEEIRQQIRTQQPKLGW